MPDGFFRSIGTKSIKAQLILAAAHPVAHGRNGFNNYVVDPTSAGVSTISLLYENFFSRTTRELYPHPTGPLRTAWQTNLGCLLEEVRNTGCPQIFPYGQD
jgi:hypothetical protein